MATLEKNSKRTIRQTYFVAKELQATIALLVVLALLGGLFLQSISKGLNTYLRLESSYLGVFMTVGYIAIIAFLAIFFSHRLVGPFKRLEYEMRIIAKGELDKRLSVRTRDDLHVRNFTEYLNEFINNFEEMSKDYNKVNAAIDIGLEELAKMIESEKYHPTEIKNKILSLQKHIHEFRERW
ncbi:MAG: methyl-accepting chemotaxis protein [Deltaproteobacteria bacterium]|nr:methyl-accepting chemotaxis protein [Deltaproteobacteria bacterium]